MDSSFCLFYQLQGDFNDLDAQRAAGGLGGHGFADMRADERLADRGLVGELAVGRIGFRRANNGNLKLQLKLSLLFFFLVQLFLF